MEAYDIVLKNIWMNDVARWEGMYVFLYNVVLRLLFGEE
jgi:hypothetical protein